MPSAVMSSGLSSADRKLLWGAAALAVLLLASMAAFAPSATGEASAIPSSYDSSSGGALAAYMLLGELHYPVRRWEQPPANLRMPGEGSLLILADPADPPSRQDREALMHYVESGGRILFSGPAISLFFPGAGFLFPNLDPAWKEFHPSFPGSLSRAAGTIVMRPAAFWTELTESQIQFYGSTGRAGDQPVVVAWRIGQGEVFWWAGATPLTNAGISEAGNLDLFLNTMDSIGRRDSATIYWDEYFHGARGSLWGYIQKTPIPWGCVQLGILMLAVLFTFSRRAGPLFHPAPVSRLSPLEFIETMGGLYQRAGAAAIPVDVSYRRLHRELSRRLGLPVATGDAELARTAQQRLGLDPEIAEVLREASLDAKLRKLPARQALRLVKKMERYLLQLRMLGAPSQEKN